MGTVTRIAALWLVLTAGYLGAQQPAPPAAPAAAKTDSKAQMAVFTSFYKAELDDAVKDYEKSFTALQTWYLNSLDKLLADRIKAGDLDGSVSIKTERERASARKDPTPEDVKAMSPILAKLRAMYEPARKKIADDSARRKDAARSKYMTNLEALQKRFTIGGDLDGALAIKGEKDRISAEIAESAGVTPLSASDAPASNAPSSGATNPKTQENVLADSRDFSVTGDGVTIATLANGGTAFSNRGYTWKDVPADLSGRSYTKSAGGNAAHLTVHGKRNTTLEVFTAIDQSGWKLAGWEQTSTHFTYTDGKNTHIVLFRRTLASGEDLAIPQGNWSGVLVLMPQ